MSKEIFIRNFGDRIYADRRICFESGKYKIAKTKFRVGNKFKIAETLKNGTAIEDFLVIKIVANGNIIAIKI